MVNKNNSLTVDQVKLQTSTISSLISQDKNLMVIWSRCLLTDNKVI